jgi:putative ABC transport system permease protein
MSAQLGKILGARIGDVVQVEALEGRRDTLNVAIRGFMEDFAGVSAFMDIDALRRLMQEGGTVNGAYLAVDESRWSEFMREVKDTPRVAVTLVKKDQLESFRTTTGQSIGIIRKLYLVLAIVVAFGVVYNSARIALSERSRDLATLRVVGFTRREVAGVLLGELMLLIAAALPLGLLFGRGLATFIMEKVRTETVRLPLTISLHTYVMAVLVVLAASCASFFVVGRMLNKLDLVGVLKARD